MRVVYVFIKQKQYILIYIDQIKDEILHKSKYATIYPVNRVNL